MFELVFDNIYCWDAVQQACPEGCANFVHACSQALVEDQTEVTLCLVTDLLLGPMPALQSFCLCSFILLLLMPGCLLPHALLLKL